MYAYNIVNIYMYIIIQFIINETKDEKFTLVVIYKKIFPKMGQTFEKKFFVKFWTKWVKVPKGGGYLKKKNFFLENRMFLPRKCFSFAIFDIKKIFIFGQKKFFFVQGQKSKKISKKFFCSKWSKSRQNVLVLPKTQ